MENSTNIGEIIKSTRGKDLLLFANFTYRKVHESKNASVRWRCTVRTCTAKVYTSTEIIVEIVEIVNVHNGHDQPSIDRKMFSNGCKRKAVENLYTKPNLNLNFDFCAMAYTNIEYADMVFILGLADGNGNLAIMLWAERFPQRRVPRPNTSLTAYHRLSETGNARPVNELGRPRFVRNVANEELVLDLVHEDPELSVRRIALRTGISPSVVLRILHQNHMRPYHRQRVQKLLPHDYPARLIFSQTIISKIAMNPNFLKNILFTDEAVFTKDGIFNQHRSHLWSEENPHAIRIRGSQYKFSINIWCGLVGNTLLGPHELPARLNGQGFLYFIVHQLPVLLENVPLEEQETMWFMLDGAPPHHTNAVRQQLHYSLTKLLVEKLETTLNIVQT
ncbi:uncharacterized protein LOC111030441 [Myzus persicae]|uniref:uncharacterized protein LOC111030441 n=1 Tax=Myzus persicae TaxID=13164 RepID=UPI000B93904A|nr:uncharacterized protein LOC111030441 [Myzus persicae]